MKYNVGDVVGIKDDLYKGYDCTVGCILEMVEYKGKIATITRKENGAYNIDIDDGRFFWDDYLLDDGFSLLNNKINEVKKENPISKIGIEIEYNSDDEYDIFESLKESGYTYGTLYRENDIICEARTPPLQIEKLPELFYVMSNLSFINDHPPGMYDFYSGSFHTHISFKNENFKNLNETKFNRLIVLLPFMCRVKEDNNLIFRTAVPYRAKIDYCESLDFDSKDYWLTAKDEHNGIEVRLNETIPLWVVIANTLLEIEDKSLESFTKELCDFLADECYEARNRIGTYYVEDKKHDFSFNINLNKIDEICKKTIGLSYKHFVHKLLLIPNDMPPVLVDMFRSYINFIFKHDCVGLYDMLEIIQKVYGEYKYIKLPLFEYCNCEVAI